MSNYEQAQKLAYQQADVQAFALLAVADAIRERRQPQVVYQIDDEYDPPQSMAELGERVRNFIRRTEG